MMNRKLATDIDRALKDVNKGVEQFDEIYRKGIDADTQAKKEKAEMELKTQIKKLQRTRDQIKGWISSEEIREKDALLQARRVIEIRMEQFKRAEKEAKTKAFSKEGLAQADKLDPEEQARQECRDWVNESLEQIREQKDTVSADLEALQSKKGKKNKEELEEIQEKLRQHTWHVHNLEMVLRGLDNDVLNHTDVDLLKDEVEYYVTSNTEPNYLFDDTVYESLELESKLGVLGKEVVGEVITPAAAAASVTSSSSSASAAATNAANAASAADDLASKEKAAKARKKQEQDIADEAAKVEALERKNKQDSLLKGQQERQRLINEREEARKRRELAKKETEETTPIPNSPQPTPASPQIVSGRPTTAAAIVASSSDSEVPSVAPPSSAAAIVAGGHVRTSSVNSVPLIIKPDVPTAASIVAGTNVPIKIIPPLSQQQDLPPTSAPSGPVSCPWPTLDPTQRLSLFDASLSFIPNAVDSERSKMYVPQNPFADVPQQFPATPAPRFENSQLFERMDIDSLFFVFFHQPGTYQQFLAARELKRHDWRYHKQYNVWMQRYEDPTVATGESELGTFVYFDPQSWTHRVKTNFNLEYSKMEV